MKRITSTLLVAALPALAMPLLGSLSGRGPASAAQIGQQTGRPGQGDQDGSGGEGQTAI